MRYISAFILKFVLTTIVLWVILGLFFTIPFSDIFTTSVILSTIAFIGDVFILPRIGNALAVFGDIILTFITIWALGNMLFVLQAPVVTAALLSAIAIGLCEIFFHRYMKKQVFTAIERDFHHSRNMQTEYSEEIDLEKKSDE